MLSLAISNLYTIEESEYSMIPLLTESTVSKFPVYSGWE